MPDPLQTGLIPPIVVPPGSEALIHALGLLRDTHVPITLVYVKPSRSPPDAELRVTLETRGLVGRLANGGFVLLLIGTGLDLAALWCHPALAATPPLAVLQGSSADIGAPEDLLLQLVATTHPAGNACPQRLAA